MNLLQDPFCVLTRHLHSPDLNSCVSEPTFFFRPQMHHLSLTRSMAAISYGGIGRGRHICTSGTKSCESKDVKKNMLESVKYMMPRL